LTDGPRSFYLRQAVLPTPEDSILPPQALTRSEASEVLRYWLASLQLEEALATRPRARRPLNAAPALRLDAPSVGHDYFKLPLDDALESLLCKHSPLQKPVDAELGAFFETWLAMQYRRGDDDRESSHLLAFPAVHLPRGELAGLLRYSLRVRFVAPDGGQFKVPTRSERRRKVYPSAPSAVRLTTIERNEQKWPFFIDTRLLHQQLGVARESIDALFAALRQRSQISEAQMLGMLCELLENELHEGEARAALAADSAATTLGSLERITVAMGRLLARRGGRSRVYPVAVVLDGTRAKTTWHLQRELQLLLEERPEVAWDLDSCLGAYLTGAAQPIGSAVQRTQFPGPALSQSQRRAAERCLGSRLTAVQGPPGTGKTTLILHLAAEALVRQVDKLADHGVMGDGLFVVTSTNNRAVDNVVDPLNAGSDGGLALAMRAGSQKVCEHLLAPQLVEVQTWLGRAKQQTVTQREEALAAALERFKHVRQQLNSALAAHARVCEEQTQRNQLRFELRALPTRATAADMGSERQLSADLVIALHAPLQKARKRLQHLCELCEAQPGLAQLSAVDRYYRSSAKRDLPALEQAVHALGLSLELDLPPDLPPSIKPDALMEVWGAAAETALARVEALQQRLAGAAEDARLRERERLLRQRLSALGPDAEQPADSDNAPAALQAALFTAAVGAREAWAALHSDELSELVASAIDAARNVCSLRPIWSDDPARWQHLCQLFGIWGCTLLSMGNCFPAEHDVIERLIIDEAGQCHPTYAVSGLLRSRSALIIGDVHQLEPVIDLEPDDDERVVQSCKLKLSAAALAPYRVHSEARCSVQALADRAVMDRARLTDHFRCQPEIIAICDALCDYGLQVHTPLQGPSVHVPFLSQPVNFVDVAGEQERLAGSWHNTAELALTLELVQALLALGVEPNDLAVITPYRGQLEQLQKQLVRMAIPIDRSLEMLDLDGPSVNSECGLTLGTVHRFQGGERSIVIFSSVVTRAASLGFLDQRENLLNVAVSRARHRFIAVGNRAVLATGRRTSRLVRAAEPVAVEAFRRQLGLFG
jgi:RecA/RadA recombinase